MTNAGQFTVTGALVGPVGTFSNNAGGILAIGANSFTGINALNNNNGGLLTMAGGTLGVNTLSNNAGGTVSAAGTINAATSITNSSAFNLTGNLAANTPSFVNAAGTLDVNGFALTGIGALTNQALVTIDAGGALTAVTLDNQGSGRIDSAGAINATTSFANAGLVNTTGVINTPILTNTGRVNASGTINAATRIDNSGRLILTGDLAANTPLFNNLGGHGGSARVDAATYPGGIVDLTNGSLTGAGVFNNQAAVVSAGNRTLGAATFNNQSTGIIEMRNGVVTDVLTLTGGYNGTAGSRLGVDVDLSRTTGQRGDRLDIAGPTSGTTLVALNQVTPGKVFFADPIRIVDGAGTRAGGATFDDDPNDPATRQALESFGFIDYSFERLEDGSFGVRSLINTEVAVSTLTSVTAAINAINVGFQQPTSAFIASPSDPEPNQWAGGPWIRASGGRFNIESTGVASIPNGPELSAINKTTINFAGFQVGTDVGLFNINGSGYNVHVGLTGGQVKAESKLRGSGSRADFDVPFVGVYGAVTGGPFFADVLVRRDLYDIKVIDPIAVANNSEDIGAHGWAVSGSVGYRFDFAPFFVEPSAQLAWSTTSVSTLPVIGGRVEFDDIESLVGRLGVRVGTSYAVTETFAVQPFVTGSVYHEFEESAGSLFVANVTDATVPLTSDRVGTFGQVGVGVSGQVVTSATTSLIGFVRGDVRFGEKIDGTALNAGLRLQF